MEDMKTMANAIMARAMLGNGLAGQAGDAMRLRPAYLDYVQKAQESGQQAMPFQDWARQFSGMAPPMMAGQ